MPGPLVPDVLWETIEPLLPPHKAKPGSVADLPWTIALFDRDHLRPPQRNCLVDVTPRDGLWLWCDLLAATA